MAAPQYIVWNAAVPTTAAMVPVATGSGSVVKTLLQLTAPSTKQITLVAWGIFFDGAPSAIKVEVIQTTTVAGGTPTAVTPTPFGGQALASAATAGFSPTTEGTVVATTKTFAAPILTTNAYEYEWSLGREPVSLASQVVRIRVTAAASVNALCYLRYEE